MSINQIIKNIEEHSFTNKQIESILLDPRVQIIDYNKFDIIDDLNEVLEDRLDAVIFLMRGEEAIGHWVVMIANHETQLLEFFDPYGLGLAGNLRIATSNSNALQQLVQKKVADGYDYVENHVALQKLSKDVNTCALHCCLRVIFKHLSSEAYIKMIKKWAGDHKMSPDEAVVSLLCSSIIRVARQPQGVAVRS